MRAVSRPPSPRWPLAAALLAIALAVPRATLAVDRPSVESSRYLRTIQALQRAQPQLRTVFAETALTELVAIYLAEADLARSEARDSDNPGKLLGWSRAVEDYADDMLVLLDEVQQGAPVTLNSSPHEVSRLTVTDRAVILSHPRATQQAEFEQRVLSDFCSRVDCEPLTSTAQDEPPIPVSASLVTPTWSFTPDDARCTHGELAIRFSRQGNLARQRGLCRELFQELAVLATELAWQRRHGVQVDWDALAIHPVPRQPQHVVILNRTGDSILASIPLVYSTPDLLGDLRPWLQAIQENRPAPATQLEAGRYGWDVDTP